MLKAWYVVARPDGRTTDEEDYDFTAIGETFGEAEEAIMRFCNDEDNGLADREYTIYSAQLVDWLVSGPKCEPNSRGFLEKSADTP